MKKLTIALAGNPNSGKTTLFNALTGARQHVGNYPGVTVEKKEGDVKYKGYDINIVDLPGTYSLTAYSLDEVVARNFVIEEHPDVVINIIDTSNLERNLYLTTQFMELNIPLVLSFNMHDVASQQGLEIDRKRISELLGSPVVFTVATKKEGVYELLDEAINIFERKTDIRRTTVGYGEDIQNEISKVEDILTSKDKELLKKYPSRWLAVKLLEKDKEALSKIEGKPYFSELFFTLEQSAHHLEEIYDDTPEALIADRRYGFISGACSEAVHKGYEVRHTISDKIDKVLVNRVLGVPIFLAMMWAVFKFTFTFSEPLMEWIEIGIGWIGDGVGSLLPEGSAVQSLIVDGVIGGVGSTLVFVPVIFLLFLAIAFLGDTGYMARAAFIMDRFMHKVGLHGKSFIPMLLGFGCNMPAIMAARTIEDKKDRTVTILVTTFMSCGARLSVYTLLVAAFFSRESASNVIFSLYILGIVIAIVMAKIFKKSLFKGEAAPFVMELPPYRVPTLKGLLVHMWERGVVYLKKAATVIFAGCVLIWFLSNFPWNPDYSKDYDAMIRNSKGDSALIAGIENERVQEKLEQSYAGRLGKFITPAFRPLGFDDWKTSVGLVGGFIAKEIVVGTLGTLHSVGNVDETSESLRDALRDERRPNGEKMFSPLVAYSLMVFILLYVPCLASLAMIKRETNSWKLMSFSAVYTTAIGWILAFVVYQGGLLLGLG
jgi:ferrous iron transport protein B